MIAGARAADPTAEKAAALAEAARPLDDGVPEVAVVRLEQLRQSGKGDAVAVKLELGKALLAAGRPAEALRILDETPLRERAKFIRAQALAAIDRGEEALVLFREVAADERSTEQAAARFAAGQILRAIGRGEEALVEFREAGHDPRLATAAHLREAELCLEKQDATATRSALDLALPKMTAEKREKRLLRSRLELLAGRPDGAIRLAEPLVKKAEGASRETNLAALYVLADAHLKKGTPDAGDDFLEDFISKHPSDPELGRLFGKLEQLYWAERKPPRLALERWARDPAQPRQGFAHRALAEIDQRAGRGGEAMRHWEEVRKNPHPALAPALLEYARVLIGQEKDKEAIAVVQATQPLPLEPRLRAALDFESARANYAGGAFKDAAQTFARLALASDGTARPALFNAAMAWMEAGDDRRLMKVSDSLRAEGEGAPELLLEQGLAEARENAPAAASTLREFIRRTPSQPRVVEAQLALAEIAFHAIPARLDEAEKELAAARTSKPEGGVAERIDYLGVWLADARGGDGGALIGAANDFLRLYPQSNRAAEVRLKLAEAYFRRQDFANAQTQFEILAHENPDSPMAEKALFLAAQSAASPMAPHSLDHALDLLGKVIKKEGELRWTARNEQAAIARRLDKAEDALLLYDAVLKGEARPGEKREALCGKADVLVEQNKNLGEALTAYDELAADPGTQAHWRNQALFKKGVCQEKQADPEAALSTFYSVLDATPGAGKTPEFFWFYKAGFNAARLLEGEEKWQSAAAIYDRLVAAAGPRSEEARTRLSGLRLEHFLW